MSTIMMGQDMHGGPPEGWGQSGMGQPMQEQYQEQYSTPGNPTYMSPLEKVICMGGGFMLVFVAFLHMLDIPLLFAEPFLYVAWWYMGAIGAVSFFTFDGIWGGLAR